jgi:hypothetical protein
MDSVEAPSAKLQKRKMKAKSTFAVVNSILDDEMATKRRSKDEKAVGSDKGSCKGVPK